MPRISVLLPAFNAEATIGRAIESILAQTFSDLELIVVDDGSTDGTAEVVRRFQDPRLTLFDSPHVGVCGATNLATRSSSGEFVARMDADDFAWPEKLERQLACLRDESVNVVGCQVRILDSDGTSTRTMQRYERWINHETITSAQIQALRFVEFPLVNPTILARREYFEIGFTDSDLPEDYDLMLTAAQRGLQFGKVDEVLFDWHDGEHRLTRNDARYSDDAFMKCRRKHLLAGPLHGAAIVDVWGAGRTGKPWIRWLQLEGFHVRRIIEVHPRKIGQTIHGVPVVDAEAMPLGDGVPLVIAVGADRTRNLIWPHVVARGYVPGEDAWFLA